jgi:HK97 family phage major capsid protein
VKTIRITAIGLAVASLTASAVASIKTFALGAANHAHAALFGYMGRAGLIAFDFDPAEVTRELKKIGDQVKEAGEKALEEAKKGVTMSTETKEKVDELLVKQGELQARLLAAEQTLAKGNEPTEDEVAATKTAGQIFVEAKELADYVEKRDFKKSFTVHMKAITSLAASAGTAVETDRLPGVNGLPNRRMTVRDLLMKGRTSSNAVLYIKETGFTNNAGMVSEGTAKPESDITFDDETARVVKIAHFIKATTEILADFPALQSFIDGRLRYGLMFKEETQLLKGSGVGNNINGIYTQATAYSAPINPAGTEQVIDELRLMLLQSELAEYPADGIVLHPSDWAVIELLKDTTGRYIIGNPQGRLSPTLWGRDVVTTQSMTVDTALVGAFGMGAQIFDRMQAAVTVATENEDDFIKNKVTILAEERLALAVYRPEAFIKNANLTT